MAKILDMPKLSPTMEEGVLSVWHKKEGDEIAVDDLLAEVETDKATMEFRAFDKGTLLKLLVPAGSQVKLGQPVAIVGARGEDISALAGEGGAASAGAGPGAGANETPPPAPQPSSSQTHAEATAPASNPGPGAQTPHPNGPAAPNESAGRAKASSTAPPPETAAPLAQRKPPRRSSPWSARLSRASGLPPRAKAPGTRGA